jgi:hypothetical protein
MDLNESDDEWDMATQPANMIDLTSPTPEDDDDQATQRPTPTYAYNLDILSMKEIV